MMDHAAARKRYSTGAIILHWAIAVLVLYNLCSGLLRDALPHDFFQFHVSSGITILFLTVIRIGWRLTHKPPPMLPMSKVEKGAAHIVHFLLYCAMLAAPLTGWAMVSAHADKHAAPQAAEAQGAPAAGDPAAAPAPKRHPQMIWGLVELPKLSPITRIGEEPDGKAKLKELHETFEERHEQVAWLFLLLLILHLGGALKHQFIDKERELARMGIGKTEA